MNIEVFFRPAISGDSPAIAELFGIASGGVAKYVWMTLAPQYPGLSPIEIGARRYAGEEGAFSYRNCTVADLGGEVVGMMHAFPIEAEGEEVGQETGEPPDPVLAPYAGLEVPGSYYVSGIAVFPEVRGGGLGTRMLQMAKEQARQHGCREVSLLVFEQNGGAVELYERHGFRTIDRAPVVPHACIRYEGEVLLMTAPT